MTENNEKLILLEEKVNRLVAIVARLYSDELYKTNTTVDDKLNALEKEYDLK